MLFILRETQIVSVPSLREHFIWLESCSKTYANVVQREMIGNIYVSTLFLGMSGILFETMAFYGKEVIFSEHSMTYDAALHIHLQIVEKMGNESSI